MSRGSLLPIPPGSPPASLGANLARSQAFAEAMMDNMRGSGWRLDAIREAYVAGRITIEEFEARLPEVLRRIDEAL